MARQTVALPDFGAPADGIVLVDWNVSVGDVVAAGDVLAIVETNKIDSEVPAPVSGKVVELVAGVGAELAAGDPLCIIET